jgi:hypothetical protein
VDLFLEAFGWAGALALAVAFYLNSRDIYPATSKESLYINIFGSAGLLANGLYHNALPSVALNVVWFMVGVTALYKLLIVKRKESSSQK